MRSDCLSTSLRGWPVRLLLFAILLLCAAGCGGSAASPKSSASYATDESTTVQTSGSVGLAEADSAAEAAPAAVAPAPAAPPPAPPGPDRLLAGKAEPRFRSEVTRGGATSSDALAQNVPNPGPQGAPGQQPAVTAPKKDKPRSDVAVQLSPILIYTAQLTMAVFEVKKAIDGVELLGREMGGFLARRADQMIVIRVPAARFDETIARLEKMGDLINRNVTAEDVTEEFSDLEVRLKSARAVRERLEQLLAKAQKVDESVMIERELQRVGGEIERIEGRLKFLRDRAAYSTITVNFQPRRGETVGPDRFNLPVPWLHELGLRRLLTL